uniref:Glucagon / GIP / secretin / VIP family domain-containing protein n=1 Tax=Myripristis murdjan TaxID=586833 RepID=A0A667XHR3_9TELE
SEGAQDLQSLHFYWPRVQWTPTSCIEGEALSRRHVNGTFTSDVNKVLDSMATKEYFLWLMNSEASGESRRHVNGTFTSDVNKVLDSMAAKEYFLWLMNSEASGER